MLALLRSPKVIGVALVLGLVGYQAIQLRIAESEMAAMQAQNAALTQSLSQAEEVAKANEASLSHMRANAKQAQAAYQAQLNKEREEGARLHGQINELESLIADANSDCTVPAAVTERLREPY